MTKSVSLIDFENTVARLELPAFHPRAYPLAERRTRYFATCQLLDDLYDHSLLDEHLYDQLHDRLVYAYVNGGL